MGFFAIFFFCKKMVLGVFFFVLALVSSCYGQKVAVVEFSPVLPPSGCSTKDCAWQAMLKNLVQYDSFAQKASLEGAEMIVFPEDGIYGPAFPSKDSIRPFLEPIPFPFPRGEVPCKSKNASLSSPVLSYLSCIALKYNISLVADMGELDGSLQYNVAVALDETGALVARYRKYHLYYERQFDVPPTQQYAHFKWRGLRVALLICFDVMFNPPFNTKNANVDSNQSLLHDDNKDDDVDDMDRPDLVILPAWWVNVVPVAIGPAVHSSVAAHWGITMIVASSGRNSFNSGSGIYGAVGGAPAVQFFNPTMSSQSHMMMADIGPLMIDNQHHIFVPSSPKQQQKQQQNRLPFVSSLKQQRFVASPNATFNLRIPDIGCEANVTLGSTNVSLGESFALVAFDGPYAPVSSLPPLFQLRLCAVVRCASSSGDCASPYASGTSAGTGNSSLFAQVVVREDSESRMASRWVEEEALQWAVDGQFKVLDTRSQVENSTVSSVAIWKIKYI